MYITYVNLNIVKASTLVHLFFIGYVIANYCNGMKLFTSLFH